jgi:hypothetical protein
MKWLEHNALCHRANASDSAVMIGIDQPPGRLSVPFYPDTRRACLIRNNAVPTTLPNWRLPMPRYFFDIKNGHKLVDPAETDCKNDADAIDKAKVIAVGVSLDRPNGKIEVHNSLLNAVLHDKPEIHRDKPTREG